MRIYTLDGVPLNDAARENRRDPEYLIPVPVTSCDGCGRPMFIPHIDMPGNRCHWCSENAIAYRVPR